VLEEAVPVQLPVDAADNAALIVASLAPEDIAQFVAWA